MTPADIKNGDIIQALQDIAEQEDLYRAALATHVRREFVYEDLSARPELVRVVCDHVGLTATGATSSLCPDGIQRTPADEDRLARLRAYLGVG